MKTLTRSILLTLLLAAASLGLPNRRLAAQGAGSATGEQAPETFVPTEKLPADAAVSFPTDI